MLPNFLIVGAARSGTSYLYRNLKAHPEVFMPDKSEIHFFDRHYNKGIEYYASFFSGADKEKYKAIGEKSPAYMYFENIPNEIHKVIPNAKILIILRNPIDRAYSHYKNLIAKNGISAEVPFLDAIKQNNRLIEEGKYADKVDKYIKLFGSNQVKVLIYEKLFSNPHNHFNEIYDFLNVNKKFISPYINIKFNDSNSKLGKYKPLIFFQIFFQKIRLFKISRRIVNMNQLESIITPLSSEDRKKVKEFYNESNKILEKLLNIDLSIWNE